VTDYTLAVTLKRVPISADFPQFLVIRWLFPRELS
jgi:hypothetical protein